VTPRRGPRIAGLLLALVLTLAAAGGCNAIVPKRSPESTNTVFHVTAVVRGGVDVIAQGQARVADGTFVVQALDGNGRVLSQVAEHSPSPGGWVGFTARLTLPAAAATTARQVRIYEAPPGGGPPQHVLMVPIPPTAR